MVFLDEFPKKFSKLPPKELRKEFQKELLEEITKELQQKFPNELLEETPQGGTPGRVPEANCISFRIA